MIKQLQIVLDALENGIKVRNFEGGTKYQPALEAEAITIIKQMIQAEPEIAMIDAAMVEMKNIVPPLRRSECQQLIRAAKAIQREVK